VTKFLTEADIEQGLLDTLRGLGYETVSGPDIAPGGERPERESWRDVVLVERLRSALRRLNRNLPPAAIEDALRKVLRSDSPSLLESNQRFHKMLFEGVDVEYPRDGEIVYDKARLVDFDDPRMNGFLAVNQFTVVEDRRRKRRLDVVIFLNGLPVALFEIKDPTSPTATLHGAFKQLQTYKEELPSLFTFNEMLVVSDGLEARAGTLTADWDRFMPWRTVEGRDVAPASVPQLDVLAAGMFDRRRLLDLLRSFIVFEDDGRGGFSKKMAAYHQYHAVLRAVECTLRALPPHGDRRIGVVWHTQGSGKSLSMVFYAGKIVQEQALENPTLVLLTDRNDLDEQLFGTFAACRGLLRQEPKQAGSREELRELLRVAAGGVIFTTIQKFMPEEKGTRHRALSERRNIVVIADEAHRSQYDSLDGYARHVRDALPHASFIGFTGTPLEEGDRNTPAVFGDYIDIYDIGRALEDRATVPIYYEARLARLALDESERPRIDPEFEEVTEAEEAARRERLKSEWSRLERLAGADRRISQVAADIVAHFEARDAALAGKGMVVAMSRRICVDLYEALVELRPEWHDVDDRRGAIKIVMTGDASDDASWQPHIRSKGGREKIARRFKDPADPLKLVIVRDMWLTGFDVPSLHTMYLDKPMQGHTLMQAIARVNRVFRDKPGGLVVDYLGVADQLRQAVRTYTRGGGRGDVKLDMEQAVAVLLEKCEVVRGLMHGFDVTAALAAAPAQRQAMLQPAMDHVLGITTDGKGRYFQAVSELSQAFALASSTDEAADLRDEVAFYQAVRATLAKRTEETEGRRSPGEVDAAIRQIVSRAVVSDEVVDIFAAAGLQKPEISILSEEFLKEVQELPYRNLALELLQRLLSSEVKRWEKKNLVQSRSFAALLDEAIRRYLNRSLETAQLVLELIELARQMRAAERRGEDLGLSEEELAFYDALETNDSAVAVLGDQSLREIAQELTRTVRKNATIDWSRRESARANLRLLVKKTLRRHGYPPNKEQKAIDTVLAQAEKLGEYFVDNFVDDLVDTGSVPEPAPEHPFRIVPSSELKPFENAVPIYDLAVAAGRFSDEQQVNASLVDEAAVHPDRFTWAELPDYYRPRRDLFVAQVVGESMNRVIPNGGWGLFRLDPQGTRQGKVVLVQHREIEDTDTGGHYTLKRYTSEKAQEADGSWRHVRIVLRPDTDRDGYEPIVLEPDQEGDVRIVAELLGGI
jgi:type I restriction enzyme R subunit